MIGSSLYLPKDGTTRALIVSPCPVNPGGYRLTHIWPMRLRTGWGRR